MGKRDKWLKAMESEIINIESKETWKETNLPAGCQMIGYEWVFKRKRGANGKVVKYTARLVANGYLQIPAVNFEANLCR